MEGTQDVHFNNRPSSSIEEACKTVRAWGFIRWHVLNGSPDLLFTETLVEQGWFNRRKAELCEINCAMLLPSTANDADEMIKDHISHIFIPH